MGPLGDFLIGVRAEVEAVLDVPDISDSDMGDFMLSAEINHMAAGFVEDLALLAVEFGAGAVFVFQQTAVAF